MSGLEVVALVAGIVSAFSGATGLYRTWRKDRKERREKDANRRLEGTLDGHGKEVQKTYDDDFRRLGTAFAKGDDICRMELMQQLIALQQTVIHLLGGDSVENMLRCTIHPYHEDILRSSDGVRDASRGALGQLFQRLSQSAPITPYLPTPIGARTPRGQPDDKLHAAGETAPFAAHGSQPTAREDEAAIDSPRRANKTVTSKPTTMAVRAVAAQDSEFNWISPRSKHDFASGDFRRAPMSFAQIGGQTIVQCNKCRLTCVRRELIWPCRGSAGLPYLLGITLFHIHTYSSWIAKYRCLLCNSSGSDQGVLSETQLKKHLLEVHTLCEIAIAIGGSKWGSIQSQIHPDGALDWKDATAEQNRA